MDISEIPVSVELRTLNLSANYLSSLDQTLIENLPNLEILDLSSNSYITLGRASTFVIYFLILIFKGYIKGRV